MKIDTILVWPKIHSETLVFLINKKEAILQGQNSRDDHGKLVPITRYHEFQPLYFMVINHCALLCADVQLRSYHPRS